MFLSIYEMDQILRKKLARYGKLRQFKDKVIDEFKRSIKYRPHGKTHYRFGPSRGRKYGMDSRGKIERLFDKFDIKGFYDEYEEEFLKEIEGKKWNDENDFYNQYQNDPGFRKSINKEFKKSLKNEPQSMRELENSFLNFVERFYGSSVLLKEVGKKERPKFNATEYHYEIRTTSKITIEDIEEKLEEIVTKVKNEFKPNDLTKFVLQFESDKGPYFVSTKLMRVDEIDVENLLETIESMVQSNENAKTDEIDIELYIIDMPEGGQFGRCFNIDEEIKKRRCYIEVRNKDNLCCDRSIIIWLAKVRQDRQYKTIIDSRKKLQGKLALALRNHCGIDESKMLDLNDINKIARIIKFEINVVCAENLNKIIFTSDYKSTQQYYQIYLHKRKNHFNLITNIKAFYRKNYFCYRCKEGYDRVHRCSKKKLCPCCYSDCGYETKGVKDLLIYCPDCNRNFYGQKCYNFHKDKGTCDTIKNCKFCNSFIYKKTKEEKEKEKKKQYPKAWAFEHKCYHYVCPNCKEYVNPSHRCYICKSKVNKESNKLVFFDFEASIASAFHEPNFCVAQYYRDDTPYTFDNCEDFCKWLFDKKHMGYTVIAHNGKGYDFQFILNYCVNNNLEPYTIYNGAKIMYMSLKILRMRFVDSLNFIPMPLGKFPKAFGLKELKKGFFPILFNNKENMDYIGPIPNKEMYKYNSFKPEKRAEFLKWYQEQVDNKVIYNHRKELEEYCISDVNILREGCIKFRELFLKYGKIDPFQYITIASVCLDIFKSQYLFDSKSLAHTSSIQEDTYSKVSIEWLEYVSHKTGQKILHARNNQGKEVKIGRYKVDGFSPETNTAYEFNGCIFHGCPICYRDRSQLINSQSMDMRYKRTLQKGRDIKEAGYKLVYIWEHNWNKMKRKRESIQQFLKDNKERIDNYPGPLNAKDAFFGGRTEVFKLLYKFKEGEHGKYVDFTSLYPWVMFYCDFPLGHPEVITKDFSTIDNYFGFIKCRIIPPKDLYLPVLPEKKRGKLIFDLTPKLGTWTTEEVKLALKFGYKIDKIYEIHHFPRKSNLLFRKYIATFLKLKQEASGFPNGRIGEDQKTRYIKEYKEKMEIDLRFDHIKWNPGLRTIAKLCLNSLWGKFGQRDNMSQSKFVRTKKEFFEILLNEEYQDVNFNIINDNVAEMTYKYKSEYIKENFDLSTYVAAYTTSWARIRLYEFMSLVSDRVIYCDTDSIIYISRPGYEDLPLGPYLGDLTDELNGKKIIGTILAGAPKNYSYVLDDKTFHTKVKGFSLNYENSLIINHMSMEKLIKSFVKNVPLTKGKTKGKAITTVDKHRIQIDKKQKRIKNITQEKVYQITFDKRKVIQVSEDHIDTVPYS